MTEKVEAPIGLSDAVNNFTCCSISPRGVIALAQQARYNDDESEWWYENPMHPHFDALLDGAKALLKAADHLVAEVEAYDAKHGKGGDQ